MASTEALKIRFAAKYFTQLLFPCKYQITVNPKSRQFKLQYDSV